MLCNIMVFHCTYRFSAIGGVTLSVLEVALSILGVTLSILEVALSVLGVTLSVLEVALSILGVTLHVFCTSDKVSTFIRHKIFIN